MTFTQILQSCPPDSLPPLTLITPPKSSSARIHQLVEQTVHPRKIRRRTVPAIALAASLTVAAAVGAAAYGEEINAALTEIGEQVRRFFTREEQLIDPNAVVIDQSDSENEVTLTVVKAFRDDTTVYIRCRLDYPQTAGQFVLYENMTLRGDTPALLYAYNCPQPGIAIMAGDIFHIAQDGFSAGFEFNITFPAEKLNSLTSDAMTLTLRGLVAVDTEDAVELDITPIADELSITFQLGGLEHELDVYTCTPQLNIGTEDAPLIVKSIRLTPLKLTMVVRCDTQPVESPVEGVTWYPSNRLLGLNRTMGDFTAEQREAALLHEFNLRMDYIGGDGRVQTLMPGMSWKKKYPDTSEFSITFEFPAALAPEDILCVWMDNVDALYYGGESMRTEVWKPDFAVTLPDGVERTALNS
ncbi:MAG: hypothetical protein IJ493_13500 [Clostridia bacterium]|nr:hypothetical protein [Clostridia bacterium]